MNRSVLIVDDEPSICMALKRTLKRHDLTVYQANGGNEALELLQTTPVDCIISDQRMPGMKGTEFLSIAKAQFPETSRIILSGQSDLQDMEDAINIAGVRQFISKPWDDKHLLQAVNDAITHESPLSLVTHEQPVDTQAQLRKPFCPLDITEHQALEFAIKNDELMLVVDDYLAMNHSRDYMYGLGIVWPAREQLDQAAIIAMADEAGFSHLLMTWYLLQVISYSGLVQQGEILVVDVFDPAALNNRSLHKMLSLVMQPEQKLLFKLSLEDYRKGRHCEHLLSMMGEQFDQYAIMVDMDDELMSTEELMGDGLQCIAMSGDERCLGDDLMTHKRRSLMVTAAKFGIKTILSDGSLRSQRRYAGRMKFDFMKVPQ